MKLLSFLWHYRGFVFLFALAFASTALAVYDDLSGAYKPQGVTTPPVACENNGKPCVVEPYCVPYKDPLKMGNCYTPKPKRLCRWEGNGTPPPCWVHDLIIEMREESRRYAEMTRMMLDAEHKHKALHLCVVGETDWDDNCVDWHGAR